MSRAHDTVSLAEQIREEEKGLSQDTTEESDAFRAAERPIEELYAEETAIRAKFKTGTWLLGGFLGLVVGLKLLSLSIHRRRLDYEPDRATCLSCARCFDYCPVGKKEDQEEPSEAT